MSNWSQCRYAAATQRSHVELTTSYERRLVRRHKLGLLPQFQCARCGSLSLDPIGYDGPGIWICGGCEDVADWLDWRQS